MSKRVDITAASIGFGFFSDRGIKYCSFDVFDTLLSRCCLHPHDVHQLVAHEAIHNGWIDMRPEKWGELRVRSEQEARRRSNNEEIGLAEIYDELVKSSHLSEEFKDKLIALEMSVELRVLAPIWLNINTWRRAQESGIRVLAISDMYLNGEFVRGALRQVAKIGDGCDIYVSSDYRLTKRTGRLFEVVMAAMKAAPASFAHVGDNLHSDVQVPSKLGMLAIPYATGVETSSLKRRVKEMATQGGSEQALLYRVLIGTGQSAYKGFDDKSAERVGRFCVETAAPLLVSFVYWAMLAATKKGIKSLYFLARDGEALLTIARELEKTIRTGLSLKYLYVSRRACLRAAFWEYLDARFDAPSSIVHAPIEDALTRFGIEANQARIAPLSALSLEQARCLGGAKWQDLLNDDEIVSAKSTRDAFKVYLREEGLLELPESSALIDVGWNGSIQRVINCFQVSPSIGIYFALNDTAVESIRSHSQVYAKYNDGFHPDIVEAFCFGTHPTTVDYAIDESGKARPLLATTVEGDNENFKLANERQEAYVRYTQMLLRALPRALIGWLADSAVRRVLVSELRRVSREPTVEEVAAIGRISHSMDIFHANSESLARPLSTTNILRYMAGLDIGVRWKEGSIVTTLPRAALIVLRLRSGIRFVGKVLVKTLKYSQ